MAPLSLGERVEDIISALENQMELQRQLSMFPEGNLGEYQFEMGASSIRDILNNAVSLTQDTETQVQDTKIEKIQLSKLKKENEEGIKESQNKIQILEDTRIKLQIDSEDLVKTMRMDLNNKFTSLEKELKVVKANADQRDAELKSKLKDEERRSMDLRAQVKDHETKSIDFQQDMSEKLREAARIQQELFEKLEEERHKSARLERHLKEQVSQEAREKLVGDGGRFQGREAFKEAQTEHGELGEQYRVKFGEEESSRLWSIIENLQSAVMMLGMAKPDEPVREDNWKWDSQSPLGRVLTEISNNINKVIKNQEHKQVSNSQTQSFASGSKRLKPNDFSEPPDNRAIRSTESIRRPSSLLSLYQRDQTQHIGSQFQEVSIGPEAVARQESEVQDDTDVLVVDALALESQHTGTLIRDEDEFLNYVAAKDKVLSEICKKIEFPESWDWKKCYDFCKEVNEHQVNDKSREWWTNFLNKAVDGHQGKIVCLTARLSGSRSGTAVEDGKRANCLAHRVGPHGTPRMTGFCTSVQESQVEGRTWKVVHNE